MNRSLRWLILAALAATGYAAGVRFPQAARHPGRLSSQGGSTAPETSPTPDRLRADGPRRDPRTGATFAESRDRLKELSHPPASPLLFPEQERPGKDQLEVARLFALASREEMLEFLADADFSGAAPFLPSLAYARLAEISPEDALSIWSDRHHRTGKTDGIDGLVEVWAKQDPAAAERWVDGIDDPTTRKTALFALLKGAVETAPDLVERRLTEIDGIHEPSLLVNLLAWKLEPTRFPSLADRLLSWRRTTWGAQDQLDSLLGIWGQRDGPAMMAWLTGQAPGRLHDHVLLDVAESRAKADPAAFVREIGPSLADNEPLAEMAGQAWLRWLQTGDDPDGAMDWFRTHGEHLTGDSSWYWSEWTEESAGRVLAHLSGLPDGTQKQQLIQRVLRGLSSTDARVALDHGKSLLPPGEETDLFFVDTLSSLAWGDPAGALDWALRNLETDSGQQRSAVQSVMGNWAMTNPLAAMERARNLPAPLQTSVYTGIVHHWVQSAPDQVLGYLKSRPGLDADALANLARGAFRNLGSKRGGETSLAEALALPGDTLRSQAVRGLFNGWSSANAETAATALQTLAPGPLRDIAIEEFARQVGGVDREAAFAWSLEIGDSAKRRSTVFGQGKQWLDADREAATRWIETSATLPEAWKAELLKPAP